MEENSKNFYLEKKDDEFDKIKKGLDKCLERAGITREKHKDGGIVTHNALQDCFDVIELLRKKY